MIKLLSLLLSLIGLAGQGIVVYVISLFVHPQASLLLVMGIAFVAYIYMIMIMLMGMSLIETIIVVLLITLTGLAIIFSLDDRLSNTVDLLLWGMITGAWYMPVFALSLGRLLDVDKDSRGTPPAPDNFKAAAERQARKQRDTDQ